MIAEDLNFGLPAPNDCELAAADARKRKRVINYNEFVHAAQINLDRWAFHRYVIWEIKDYQPRDTMTYTEWLKVWTSYCEEEWKREALIQAEDARDLRETQQDALI